MQAAVAVQQVWVVLTLAQVVQAAVVEAALTVLVWLLEQQIQAAVVVVPVLQVDLQTAATAVRV
jgi:hypothetical protein